MRDVPNLFEGTPFYTDKYEDATHVVTRVVDGDTGEPIAGARFYAIEEHDYAMARMAQPGRVALSNADGWVRYEIEPWEGGWHYVEKDGYGPHASLGVLQVFELRKGVDHEVVLRNAVGEPVPNARIGYYLGCGHTPDSRQVRTDANGRAVVPCIDPREGLLFPLTSAIESGDFDVQAQIIGPPSVDVVGRVIEADGRPVAGAYVGTTGWNHGPWTRTDDDGRFRLVGMGPLDWVRVFRDMGQTDRPAASFRAPPRGVQRTVMLGLQEKKKRVLRIETGADVWVWAVRDGDGFTAANTTDEDGTALLHVPDGRYTVTIGRDIGAYEQVQRRIENYEVLRVTLKRNPPLRFDASRVDEDFDFVLASRHEERKLSDDEREAGVVHVRRGMGFVLRMQYGRGHCGAIVKVPDSRGAPLVLPKPQLLPWMVEDDEELPVHRVRVLTAGGWPVEGVYIGCEGGGEATMAHTDEDGWAAIELCGDEFTVQADDCLPFRVPVTDEIRLGSCAIEVELLGDVDTAEFIVDGEHFSWLDDTFVVRGLEPGPHRLLVAPKGYLAKECRVVLEPGETRKLALRFKRP